MRMRLSRVGGFRSEEIAAWARRYLEPGTVVVSDALGFFAAVQFAGCFCQPFVTGGGPASARHPALTWVNAILGNVKRSLHGTYHHLSSKQLPRYLAEFSYRFNRRFSPCEMFPASPSSPCARPRRLTECSSWLRIMRNHVTPWILALPKSSAISRPRA